MRSSGVYASFRLLDDGDYRINSTDRTVEDFRLDESEADRAGGQRSGGSVPTAPMLSAQLNDSMFYGSYFGSDDWGSGGGGSGGGDTTPPYVDPNPPPGDPGGEEPPPPEPAPPPPPQGPPPVTLPYDVVEFMDDVLLKIAQVTIIDGSLPDEIFVGQDQGSGDGDNAGFVDFINGVIDAQAFSIFSANSDAARALDASNIPYKLDPNSGTPVVEGYGFAVYAPGSSTEVGTTTFSGPSGTFTVLRPPGSELPSSNAIGDPGANALQSAPEIIVTAPRATGSTGPLATSSFINGDYGTGISAPVIGIVSANDPALDDIGIIVTAKKPGAGSLVANVTAAWQDFWGKLSARPEFSHMLKDVAADGKLDGNEYHDLFEQMRSEVNNDASMDLAKSFAQLGGYYFNDNAADYVQVQLSYFFTT
jgi:hypothetical protein